MPHPSGDSWMSCSACRKQIPFGAVHWVCSVSTCNRSRTRLVFCSVPCWDSHVATLHHRDAWAVEALAPSREEHARQQTEAAGHEEARAVSSGTPPQGASSASLPAAAAPAPTRRVLAPGPPATPASGGSVTAHAGGPALSNRFDHDDVLIVVSKLKKYIRDRSGMNTSDGVVQILGDHVRSLCDDAIRNAAADGRKTVLDRDMPRPRTAPRSST